MGALLWRLQPRVGVRRLGLRSRVGNILQYLLALNTSVFEMALIFPCVMKTYSRAAFDIGERFPGDGDEGAACRHAEPQLLGRAGPAKTAPNS